MAENNSSAPLLPCPFCGAAARMKPSTRGDYTSIVCNSPCAGPLAIVVPNGQIEAGIAAWNTRAPQAVAAQAPAAVAVPARQLTDGTRTLRQDCISSIRDFASSKPEEGEEWDVWFAAAFDLLAARINVIFDEHATPALPATEPGALQEPETAIKEVMELVADLEREAADVGYGHGSQRLVNEKRTAIESKLRALPAVLPATGDSSAGDLAEGPLNPWQQAVDHELVTAHLGVAGTATSEEARKALNELICWHIAVATDPQVNGGFSLQPAKAEVQAVPVASTTDVVYRWQALDYSGYCYGSNPPNDLPERCNLTALYRQPDAYRAALHEISATSNLTATSRQFGRHLQQIARDALVAAPQPQPADALDAETIKKAARYDWLSEQGTLRDDCRHLQAWRVFSMLSNLGGERADAAIDAAMAAAQEGGNAAKEA